MSTMHFIASYCSVSMTKRARPNPTACIGFRDVFLFKLLTQCLIGLSCVNAFWHDPSSSSSPLQSPSFLLFDDNNNHSRDILRAARCNIPKIAIRRQAACREVHPSLLTTFQTFHAVCR